MEQDFQTSFIPKKPMIDSRAVAPRPVGILTIACAFIFFAILLSTGALYFYKAILANNITQMEKDLNLAQSRFEPSKITQLQSLDKRLRAANEVLSKHVAISPIFQTLQDVTMKTIRYTKFDYTFDEGTNSMVLVKMSGIAVGYRSIALQADLFTQNKSLIDPIFSNLSLDNTGNVLFDLNFSVDPSFVNYEQMLKTTAGTTGTSQPAGTVTN